MGFLFKIGTVEAFLFSLPIASTGCFLAPVRTTARPYLDVMSEQGMPRHSMSQLGDQISSSEMVSPFPHPFPISNPTMRQKLYIKDKA
ncbi:hypothetical protein FN846DRAFT_504352 [Sphaerosporella brunnea]|uniref:Uncharacterized protein n=1 Tax=Sphaerosporella brunnea TaxID=1250544 RepID=A0A5J5EF54_9PEZI|nr:hypothetical protein FN846DRAFT_504352 [Sphaerosporella brunnea]